MWKIKLCYHFEDVTSFLNEIDNSVASYAKIIYIPSPKEYQYMIWYREPEKLHGTTKKKKVRS